MTGRSPGRRKFSPYTHSARLASNSAWNATCLDSKTQGRASIHRSPWSFPRASRIDLMLFFKSMCWRSTPPRLLGEYSGEYEMIVPNFACMPFQILAINVLPLSLFADNGTPKFFTQPLMNCSAHSVDVASLRGSASNQRVVLSRIVRRYRYPSDCGRGPTISTWRSENLLEWTGLGLRGGLTIL